MISNSPPASEVIDPQQNLRAKLREAFLKSLGELNGEPCHIVTYEQTKLTATFTGWKTDGTEVLVRGLQTPAGIKMGAALLRTPDMLAIEFDNNISLP